MIHTQNPLPSARPAGPPRINGSARERHARRFERRRVRGACAPASSTRERPRVARRRVRARGRPRFVGVEGPRVDRRRRRRRGRAHGPGHGADDAVAAGLGRQDVLQARAVDGHGGR